MVFVDDRTEGIETTLLWVINWARTRTYNTRQCNVFTNIHTTKKACTYTTVSLWVTRFIMKNICISMKNICFTLKNIRFIMKNICFIMNIIFLPWITWFTRSKISLQSIKYVLPWITYLLSWRTYVLPWIAYVLPWKTYVLPWITYVSL